MRVIGFFSRRPVAQVVAATLVAVTTLVLGSFGAVSHASAWRRERARLRRAVAVQADELAVALALPVWNIDRDQIDQIVKGMGATPEIVAVVVRAAGRTHAYSRDDKWRFIGSEKTIPAEGLMVEARPIYFAKEPIGTVQLYGTARFVEEELRLALGSTALAILATDLALILFVYVLLWRTVMGPLVQIERAAAAITAG
ncbi:MAG TPA: hybrid sensor histidine kinase/response regulator, partial [Thermoanaerobaculia bacterium]|nr:hybrid sensor histidine kinase/response regulator [Thermoanaerobaculia bacterium]